MLRKPVLIVLLAGGACLAEEGMWLFNEIPAKVRTQIQKKYGFELTEEFLNHLRLSSVQFGGASGSFVSPDGLIFTNHHVGQNCIHQLSNKENDYMANGFWAATRADERTCPDTQVRVLQRIEDVTATVNAAVPAGTGDAEANQLRKAEMTRLEKACAGGRANAECDVVTLYSGGLYHLYEYRKYSDVRLVFAPEISIAFFGGDPDNFTFPRYDLDITFFRAYEDGKPVSSPNYLKWSKAGAQRGELNLVTGHPGTTGRLNTYAELEFFRDVSYRLILDYLEFQIGRLQKFSEESDENRRIAESALFGLQNSYKAYSGFMAGLKDPALMAEKKRQEQALMAAIAKDPKKEEAYGKIWSRIADAYTEYRRFFTTYYLLEPAAATPLRFARPLWRLPAEKAKADGQRLREYTDANLASLRRRVLSPAPVYESLETVSLTNYLETLLKRLGPQDETVQAVLKGRTPAEAARHYVSNSKLLGLEERKRLYNDGKAVESSDDTMIELARILDGRARALRKEYEDKVEAVIRNNASKLALARFSVSGSDEYPDATGTLRLAYGDARGYTDGKGRRIPWATDLAGLYRRATGKDPYKLPASWVKAKGSLNLKTAFNYVTTADTHGGNSGSPTVNTKGEIIGILFDGNIESLPNRFVYDDKVSRSVHVAAQGIVEALKKVYKADRLAEELSRP